MLVGLPDLTTRSLSNNLETTLGLPLNLPTQPFLYVALLYYMIIYLFMDCNQGASVEHRAPLICSTVSTYFYVLVSLKRIGSTFLTSQLETNTH